MIVYCVNDGAVMDAWAKDQGVEGSMVTFLADTRCELTKALKVRACLRPSALARFCRGTRSSASTPPRAPHPTSFRWS